MQPTLPGAASERSHAVGITQRPVCVSCGAVLAEYGVEVSIEELCPIVRWLRRRGFELAATPGEPGYELLRWRHRFRRRRRKAVGGRCHPPGCECEFC